MVESITHQTYKIVPESEADALAWVFVDKEQPMKRIGFKFPEIKDDEVRIKVTYSGLCHSDLHTVREEWGKCSFPLVPGHEILGVVTQVGSGVKDFKVGDKAGFGCQRELCGECEYCKMDMEQLCDGKGLTQQFTYGDKYWGGYATSLQQPAKFYFKIPEGLPDNKVPPLFCAGITTYAPIARHAKHGQEAAVIGIGGLGHMGVQYLKAWGCTVTAFTSSKGKEEFIKKLGADRVVITSEETLKQEAGKFQFVLNTLPVSDNFLAYVGLAKKMGTFVCVGAPPHDTPASFSSGHLIFTNVNLTGSLIGSRKEIREMLEFSAKHNIVPLCEEFDFEDFPKAFDKLEHGRPIFRCVVNATKAKTN